MKRISPERITALSKGEIFVFGSNMGGEHFGGAAYLAVTHFGAIMGQPVGLQGQSYAIPTLKENRDQLPIVSIQKYVDEFIQFAVDHPAFTFLVTEIGCGIAGFALSEMAPLFKKGVTVENIYLPARFYDFL
jgi:hypothetical protein